MTPVETAALRSVIGRSGNRRLFSDDELQFRDKIDNE